MITHNNYIPFIINVAGTVSTVCGLLPQDRIPSEDLLVVVSGCCKNVLMCASNLFWLYLVSISLLLCEHSLTDLNRTDQNIFIHNICAVLYVLFWTSIHQSAAVTRWDTRYILDNVAVFLRNDEWSKTSSKHAWSQFSNQWSNFIFKEDTQQS